MKRPKTRLAFQTLLAKLRPPSNLAGSSLMSWPCAQRTESVKRTASAPYCSIMSSGSMPLPSDFDIQRPCLSLIMPVMNTSRKGATPVKCTPAMIIRAIQKKRMS